MSIGLKIAMAHGSGKGDYSDEDIEQIIGMGEPEAERTLREIRDTISENPLLVTGLVFALGILIGVSLGCARKNSS